MRQRWQSGTRMRVLRCLLALVALVGAGLLQGAHCLTAPAAGTGHSATAGHEMHSHEHADVDDGSPHTALDTCHGQPAPATPVTVATAVVDPPTPWETVPVAVPAAAHTPRIPTALALTEICVSRT
ncbi:hypothetical protein COUCH_14975 [Couchioplanes caeruleus]|uniref:hypothetical protein n=1 Tax=Couchioplanes caeruleus TaxID=56438 RepID=UPI0020BF6E6D|nr:hypothetical protein [Couchioplanes caeruleus]UQU67489.1 hypothetical protein COUCH_14975 [Couchioplanes caeruleus]